MTTRWTAGIAAGALAVGLITGAAGAIALGTAASPADRPDPVGSMMGGVGGADMRAMMDVKGASMMGEPEDMGPGSSQHDVHHPDVNR